MKKMTSTDLTNALVDWARSAAAEQVKWLKSAHPGRHTEKALIAYEAGFTQGYKAAINDLKRHGFIETK
jgi:hypothetical protein